MCLTLRITQLVFLIVFLLSSKLAGQVPPSKEYHVVFFNTENLFDPFDDPTTNDDEYTPAGKNHWTMSRLEHKVRMVYRAIIAAADGNYPDIIGLSEIENLWVLDYLLENTPFGAENYGIVHKESPDPRGIDVALLYRRQTVRPLDYSFLPVNGKSTSSFSSRDILYFKAELGEDTIHFLVNHWPSRSGGYMETRGKRDLAARIARKSLDSLRITYPDGKILLMGDFNATPDETCLTKILGANCDQLRADSSQLVNLSQCWLDGSSGTIRTKGKWEIFDQFICTDNLLHGNRLMVLPAQTTICRAEFLLEPDERYLGKKPFRTYLGPIYHGGVSDHLPIATLLKK